jgi:hypothetical protein
MDFPHPDFPFFSVKFSQKFPKKIRIFPSDGNFFKQIELADPFEFNFVSGAAFYNGNLAVVDLGVKKKIPGKFRFFFFFSFSELTHMILMVNKIFFIFFFKKKNSRKIPWKYQTGGCQFTPNPDFYKIR